MRATPARTATASTVPRPLDGRAGAGLALALACLLGCASPDSTALRPPAAADPARRERATLVAILELVDRGADPEGRLPDLLANASDPRLRERAAWALGELPAAPAGADAPTASAATAALVRALAADSEASVRRAAAFALGLRGDRAAAPALLEALSAPDPRLRARAVEAASRIDDAHLRRELPFALFDPDAGVRRQAALAAQRLPAAAAADPSAARADAEASELDHALLEALRGAPDGSPQPPEVERALLFSLGRRGSTLARRAFLDALRARDPETRVFAVLGLAGLPAESDALERDESRLALVRAAADPDWRVACEAVAGLGKRADAEALPSVSGALAHASAHVRRAAALALGEFADGREAALRSAQSALADRSAWVRSAALVSSVRLAGAEARPALEDAARAEDARLRVGAAEALAFAPPELALPRLEALAADPDARVRWSALESLARFATRPEARRALRALLGAEDAGLRLGAVLALGPALEPAELPLFAAAAHGAGGLESEIAFEVLAAVARLPGEEPLPLLRAQLGHPDAYVAARARALLGERGVELAEPPSAARPARSGRGRALLEAAADLLLAEERPRVELRTERGPIVLALEPRQAPLHVASFLALVREGHYDGLVFHRVVSDFVVQGGDLRGDGNGAAPFGGRALRREFGPEPFERGSLGMPRNADPDSGGSQIFLTHRATPHLDGRYTRLGSVLEGEDVLDRIEAGDSLLSAAPLERAR